MSNSTLFDLTGKQALVTGGAMGIGRAAALALATAGADVAIVDRNEPVGLKAVEEIRALGRNSFFVSCDVSDTQQVEASVGAVSRELGQIDIAVNSAGIYRAGLDEEYSHKDWDQVLGINLTGTWLCACAQMRHMMRKNPIGGKIINVASIGATTVTSNAAYDASKAAVVHMTRTLAARWGRYNVNVNCVSPGYVIGGMGSKSRSREEREHLRELTPLGHVLRLEDLQGPILFLASSASDFVTGQNLVIDGGLTLGTWLDSHEREVPPRVSPQEEVVELKRDLIARGIAHDEEASILDS